MQFSEQYGIPRAEGDGEDWFDPLLITDTRLYVDPFRVFISGCMSSITTVN